MTPCARAAANGSASAAEHGGGGAGGRAASNGHSPAAQGGERGGGGAHPAAAGGKGGGNGGVKGAYANGSADPRDHGAARRPHASSAADVSGGDGGCANCAADAPEGDGAADAGARGGGGGAELVISSSADKLTLGGGAGYARPSAEPLFPAALRGRAHAPLCLPGAVATWHRRGEGLCVRVAARLPGALGLLARARRSFQPRGQAAFGCCVMCVLPVIFGFAVTRKRTLVCRGTRTLPAFPARFTVH